jgi:hypothetical protein
MSNDPDNAAGEAAREVAFGPLAGQGGAIALASSGAVVGWVMWAKRRHAWAILVSTLPLLYLVRSVMGT